MATAPNQLSGLLAAYTPGPAIDLGPADPLAQRLRAADAQPAAIATMDGQSGGYSGRTSATIWTARSRSSGGWFVPRPTTPSSLTRWNLRNRGAIHYVTVPGDLSSVTF